MSVTSLTSKIPTPATACHSNPNEALHVAEDEPTLTTQFVTHLLKLVRNELALGAKPFVTIGLSGGSGIKTLSQELIRRKDEVRPLADKLRFFFCDERFVPLDSADSTYGCYRAEGLFDTLGIAPEHVLAIRADATSCDECARDYAQRLSAWLNDNGGADIVQLGMGPDGHTCSLFPGHELVVNANKYAGTVVTSVVDSPKPPAQRVTLTLDTLCKCKHILFYVWGESKANVAKRVVVDHDTSLPSACVEPSVGSGCELKWFMDRACAKEINL